MFKQCTSPRNHWKDGCNNSHNTLLYGAEEFFPPKSSTKNIKKPTSSPGASKPYTGHKQPIKTTTLSSITDVKTLLELTALQMTNSSGTNTTTLVLCDTACSNSWVFNSLAVGFDLQGTSINLNVQGINKCELNDKKSVQLTVTPHKDHEFKDFTLRLYVGETMNLDSDINHNKSLQETYPQ